MATRVIHIKSGEPYDVYIGRGRGGLGWGNPFSHKEGTLAQFKVATRDEAIESYQRWLLEQPELLAKIPTLKDKVLACWCRPSRGFQNKVLCHGQILAALADGCRPEDID